MREGRAALAMMPIENSVAGRVADIHHLMPDSGLHIIGEHFERVNHHLLALPGATLKTIKTVRSHVHALSQCRKLIRALGLEAAVVAADTAGAAAEIAAARRPDRRGDRLRARRQDLRPRLAEGEHRGRGAQHHALSGHVARRRGAPPRGTPTVTTFVFRVRNVPAALYKAMGGFATNGVNMTKLESYMVGGALHRDPVLCRCRGASRRPAAEAGARGAALLLARGEDPRRLPRPPAAHRRLGSARNKSRPGAVID